MFLVIIGIVFGVFAFGCVCHALIDAKKKRRLRASELYLAGILLAVSGIIVFGMGLKDPSKNNFEYKTLTPEWVCSNSVGGAPVCIKQNWRPGTAPIERSATAK